MHRGAVLSSPGSGLPGRKPVGLAGQARGECLSDDRQGCQVGQDRGSGRHEDEQSVGRCVVGRPGAGL